MAGYTSRILLTFTIPFVGFVLWFLKKKKSPKSISGTATQVEDSTTPTFIENNIFDFDIQSSLRKNQENSCEDSMQLKETQTPESQSTSVSEQNEQLNGLSHECIQQSSSTQNLLLNDTPETNTQQNGTSDSAILSPDSKQNNVSENDIQDKSISTNCVQQNGVTQKNVLKNGTQQNGTSSKAKKKKSKGREKSNIRSKDNGRHLEDEIELIQHFEDLSVSSKNELMNTINKNEMNKIHTNCASISNIHVNGDAKSETVPSSLKNETAKAINVITERNSSEKYSETLNSEQLNTDPCTSLILPADYTNGDMMGSPGAYCDSLDSTDSGRGGSELHVSPTQESAALLSYAFEIPQKLVGLLIGRQGKNVNLIKQKTNADILIKRHPTNNQNKVCLISGTEDEINAALRKIREKFPPERFPNVTLSQICFLPFMPCPENLMLRLPEGSSFDVMLSATVTAGHFFLQQPTHPTFHSLIGLTYQMSDTYNQDLSAPPLPHMEKGFICAANLANNWYRAEIDEVFYETDECRVKFLDYGGYSILPRAALKQINYQFMNVPFQATECYLGLVTPPEGKTDWPPQATAYFEELAQGQILQGFIIAYAENGVPYVQLYRITGVEHIDINMALVQKGHARYIKPQAI